MDELFGGFSKLTHEWAEGLVASVVQKFVTGTSIGSLLLTLIDPTLSHKWVVFDGPVDALWIENMNTVLDDNKLLCLANGQRIKITPSMRMVRST